MTSFPPIPRPLADEIDAIYGRLDSLYLDIARNDVAVRRAEVLLEKLALDPARCAHAFAALLKTIGLGAGQWDAAAIRERLEALRREGERLDVVLDEMQTQADRITQRAREAAGTRGRAGADWPPRPRPLQKRRDQSLRTASEELTRLWLQANGIENVVWAKRGSTRVPG